MHMPHSPTRRTFWALAAFYGLIAFEFFYMASPFALYFYSVYAPGLSFINHNRLLAWLSSTFLPHFAVTSAGPLNRLAWLGTGLFLLGLLGFCLGAGQVYYHKLARKGAVTGGIYRSIRHPQYAALALSSFGLLLLWPRFIVLLSFVSMLFAYYFLARLEERECAAKFGPTYQDYCRRTGMFLPWRIPALSRWPARLPALPRRGLARAAALGGLWLAACGLALGLAAGLQQWTLASLYTRTTPEAVYLSVAPLEPARMDQLIALAMADPQVRRRVDPAGGPGLNYILPLSWYDAEIPMHPLPGQRGHAHPAGYSPTQYRLVFTRASLPPWTQPVGRDILRHVQARTPLLEVVVDLEQGRVVSLQAPIETPPYAGIPVPVY